MIVCIQVLLAEQMMHVEQIRYDSERRTSVRTGSCTVIHWRDYAHVRYANKR